MIKVLNLYSGIGGNRKLWQQVEVTAVEYNPKITNIYKALFPNDKIIVTDAHKYLIEHSEEYDFIWSSPPCPTHSVCNNFLNAQGIKRYPDMRLYQEIIYLKQFFKGKFVIENVQSYYNPLIKPVLLGRHYFWSNFWIPQKEGFETPFNINNARATTRRSPNEELKTLQEYHGFDLSPFKIKDKRLLLRNCVNPELGKYVFDCAYKEKQFNLRSYFNA